MAKYLITGGTGTIGKAVVKRLLRNNQEVVVFSRDEDKQHNMKLEFNDDNLKFVIGDVRDYYSIDKAIMTHKPDYVFHAAAMKHVPFCENFVLEGIKTNVLGSNNVFDACIAHDVKKVIFLSTDKAVEPSCIMGMSKAIAEKIIDEKIGYSCNTIFCITRFGNILRSRGSVVPVFEKQIQNGEKMTITDPSMTRFIMSVDEAVNLVMYAFEHGNQGDLFVYNAKSCNILDLAKAVALNNGVNSPEFKIIGNRGNEKKHESLLTDEEMSHSLFSGDFYLVNKKIKTLNVKGKLESNQNLITVDEIAKLL